MDSTSRARVGRWSPLVVVAAVLLAALTPGVAWSAPEEKVVICHRTNSPTNPYNQIAVAESSVISAHGDHTGPIFEPGADEWVGIIPPVPGLPQGRNWPEGSSVLDNGCEMQPDVGPLPTATVGDAECTGPAPRVLVRVSNDPDATQPAFFAIAIEGDVVEEVGPVPAGESETVVLADDLVALEDQTVTVEVRSGGEVIASHVVTVDCRGPDPDVDLEAQIGCDGETSVGSATITNNDDEAVEVTATVGDVTVAGPIAVASGETETPTADLSAYEDQTIVVVITVDEVEVATYTVTPDCVPPVPQPRVAVSGSVCPPPLATVTLANDGDPASTVVYGVRVDGELVQESAPIYGGDETTIVADLSAYEDQTVLVALVANGEVLGRRLLRIDCEQPPGTGPDGGSASGGGTRSRLRGPVGAHRHPLRRAAGPGPGAVGPGARRCGCPGAAGGAAAPSAGPLTGSSRPASCAARDASNRSRTPSLR